VIPGAPAQTPPTRRCRAPGTAHEIPRARPNHLLVHAPGLPVSIGHAAGRDARLGPRVARPARPFMNENGRDYGVGRAAFLLRWRPFELPHVDPASLLRSSAEAVDHPPPSASRAITTLGPSRSNVGIEFRSSCDGGPIAATALPRSARPRPPHSGWLQRYHSIGLVVDRTPGDAGSYAFAPSRAHRMNPAVAGSPSIITGNLTLWRPAGDRHAFGHRRGATSSRPV